ncbi:hypothetical protein V8C42DRAFT_324292 [Trichoderma barbatum]
MFAFVIIIASILQPFKTAGNTMVCTESPQNAGGVESTFLNQLQIVSLSRKAVAPQCQILRTSRRRVVKLYTGIDVAVVQVIG